MNLAKSQHAFSKLPYFLVWAVFLCILVAMKAHSLSLAVSSFSSPPAPEVCNNNIDDDGDGLIDCDDPDCTDSPVDPNCSATCLTTNNGFESNFTGWSTSGSPQITTTSYAGSNAASLDDNGDIIRQTITGLSENNVYMLSFWARATSNKYWERDFVEIYDNSSNLITDIRGYLNLTTTYQQFSVIFTAPAQTDYVRVAFPKYAGSEDIYVDEVCFKQISDDFLEEDASCGANIISEIEGGESTFWMDDGGGWYVYGADYGTSFCFTHEDTIRVTGNMVNGGSAGGSACGMTSGWFLDITLYDRKTWAEWGGNYDDFGIVNNGCPDLHTQWEYWEVEGTMTGLGCNEGESHDIISNASGYQVQVGYGANRNTCNYGMAGWMVWDDNGTNRQMDIYFEIEECDYVNWVNSACCPTECCPVSCTHRFIVNTTDDNSDTNPGDGKCEDINCNCPLRAAIEEANAWPGADTILFKLPTSDSRYTDPNSNPGDGDEYWTFEPFSPYDDITEQVFIDATSQTGAACGDHLAVQLNGENAGDPADAFHLVSGSDYSHIRGFVINRFDGDGFELLSTNFVTIACNRIGTDISGTIASNNQDLGIRTNNSRDLQIGGLSTYNGKLGGEGNVISASLYYGMSINNGDRTKIQGNFIGTDVTGTLDLGNGDPPAVPPGDGIHGIALNNSLDVIIGGETGIPGGTTVYPGSATPFPGNIISGNRTDGIRTYNKTATVDDNLLVEANFIGTDVTGTNPIPNSDDGIDNRARGGKFIDNIISGNADTGIELNVSTSDGNLLQGNFIGVDVNGTSALANGQGIKIRIDADDSVIGGTTAAERNIISGNNFRGIQIQNSSVSGTRVIGNYIGTDVTGTQPIGNGLEGIEITDAEETDIGGHQSGEGNIIAHNGTVGINIVGSSALNNTILANSIYNNGDLGIDLLDNDVTANDPNDSDFGPNDLLNFPLAIAFDKSGGDLDYNFNADLPNGDYRIDFFSSDAADPLGHGEGQRFLGHIDLYHNGSGVLNFNGSITPLVPVSGGEFISMTTTLCYNKACTNLGHTSEFSGITSICENADFAGGIFGDESKCGSFDPELIQGLLEPTGGGGTLEYQWQQNTGTWSDIAGANSASYDPPSISSTTLYRRGARRNPCSPYIYSNVVTKEVMPCQITTYVWEDIDKDGIQDGGEPAIQGVTVNLINELGVVVATTTTNGSGLATFSGVEAGNYYLLYDPISNTAGITNFEPTTKDAGSNQNIDSDINTSTGLTDLFSFNPSTGNKSDIDAGFYKDCPPNERCGEGTHSQSN